MKNKRIVMVVSMLFLLSIVTLGLITKTVMASSSNRHNLKLVTSIKIEEGDTLWSIANEFKTEEYKNISEYINEIKKCNGIENDTIYEGRYIIVPYYEKPN